ncbi:SURF1 family protein [Aliiroseovarius subalbicans]|uniref:SURF1 family protein n=1 Tax=Aliiroseovarius subalbicans TaxID=2925840 RepID=UPI001F5985A7|nr:SURF1 family protein [Aliiroseovarius subalbicans]MCI2398911.1 SURF1 family protein [Aliiroseovarius subalbicans]
MRIAITFILSVAVLAVFLSLGTWQMQRLHWKEGVLEEIDAAILAGPVALPAQPDPESHRFLPVVATGDMGSEELHVLVSTRDHGAGFRIIAPFDTGDRRIMVDRGFVRVTAKDAERLTGAMQVTGNLHWPDERYESTPPNDPASNYWYAREVAVMAAALNTAPVLIIARSSTDPAILPLPVTSQGIPNDHFEYAMTWFLLAATWIVMTGFALWRMKRPTN